MNDRLKKNPMVSIIIPVYNGSNYMKEAIESAINQTYKNIEVIVINDGSNDNGRTNEIAMSYGNKIKYYSKENGGVSSALNLGIEKMTGEYFSWLSHDDKYEKNKIEKQVEIIEKYPDEDVIVLCNTQQINKNSENIRTNLRKRSIYENKLNNSDIVLKSIVNEGTINGCALLIPKSAFEECGMFNENLRFCQDTLMWEKIFLKNYKLFYMNEKLVYSRVHNLQVTNTKRNLFYKDTMYIADLLISDFARISTSKNNIYYYFAKRVAINSLSQITRMYIKQNRIYHLLSASEITRLYIYIIYGQIRPIIRKLYYKFILNVSTK